MSNDGHYKLMIAGECFARGTYPEMVGVQNMHKTTKSGSKGETKTSGATMTIENDPREYPFRGSDEIKINLGSVIPGKVYGPYK